MVVESRIQMKAKGLSKRSLGETDDSFVVSEVRSVCCPDHNMSAFPPLLSHSLAYQCEMGMVLAWSQAMGLLKIVMSVIDDDLIVHQADTDHEASDTDEDESSSPRADSSSADEDDEEVFYDASDLSRSNSLQASRSLSLPAFEGDSAFDSARWSLLLILGMQTVRRLEIPR